MLLRGLLKLLGLLLLAGLTGWAVKRDGGEFDQFTGATVTPRAVVKAVRRSLEYFQANKSLLFGAPSQNTSLEEQ